MEDSEIFALGGMTNSSQAMFDRRRRILKATLQLIESKGIEGFNIRALSKIAQVAPRTLYNAFGSKDNLIALAISSNFEGFYDRIVYTSHPATLEGALDRWATAAVRNIANRHFPRIVAALYFSPNAHPEIRGAISKMNARAFTDWFQVLHLNHQFDRGLNVDRLVANLSNVQMATTHEWE